MNCKKNVSIITVYNKADFLAETNIWIKKQSAYEDIEVIQLDNRENRFSSCAQALNFGAEHSCGEYLFFMHQDLYLWDLQAVEKYVAFLSENPDAIIGVAGVPNNSGTVTDIYESKTHLERGIRANGKILPVDSLDECLIAMTRQKWEQLRFDEAACDNWHGYAVDICFNNTLHGGKNMLVPLKVCHDSTGNAQNAAFRTNVKHLIRKYRGTAITRIHGTCVDIPCNLLYYYWYATKGTTKDILLKLGLLRR